MIIKNKVRQVVYSAISLFSVAFFAAWWFTPQHIPKNFIGMGSILDILLFIGVSYVIWHPILMEVLMWAISSHIKDIRQQNPAPGLKVAFITTIVPANESLELLHKCLPAMVNVSYPHDTWLLDEGNSPQVQQICEQYGVRHFSRRDMLEYNTEHGKFTKTKGGNHNSWYDVYGNDYDIVAQVDTDFVPKRNFLTETLGYFKDPQIAFVGTPQVYGNTKDSIIAQGAAEQLHSFYGSILRGLSGMDTTLLIGANHVIRVKALKDVGHYSAHITEDLLTGMKLHTNGWKSIYLPSPLAVGEGPSTWEAYFSQQMRWAYGCMDILFHHSPRLFAKMGFRRAIYYFLLQQHYFSGIVMALSISLLSLYFFAGIRAADVDMLQFFVFYSMVLVVCWLMSVWLQGFHIYRKREGELLLAGKIVSIAAWPVWFLAFVCVIIGKRLKYKVTPKGENGAPSHTSPQVFIPHILFGLIPVICIASSIFTHRQSPVMLFWAVSTALLILCVPFIERISHALFRLYAFTMKTTRAGQNHIIFHPLEFSDRKNIIADCVFLSAVVIASMIFYIQKIGFYSDDWAFLGNFSLSANHSLLELIKIAITPNTLMRPGQDFYDALLYWLFGMQPLGYQLVNALMFVAITVLFYLVLRHLKLPRIIAVAVPMVYALLPHYSTDRFWYAAFQANLSIGFYFFSLYSGLKALSFQTTRPMLWKMFSVVSLIISALSYEVVLPLVLVNAVLFWNPAEKFKKATDPKETNHHHTVFIVVTFIAVLYILLFKVVTTTRLDSIRNPGYFLYIIESAFKVNYGTYMFQMPYLWGEILSRYANPTLFAAAFGLYLVIFWYLYMISSKGKSSFPSATWMGILTIVSIIIFLLGYAIFFTNNQVGFSATGVENRVAIAGAIGIAFSIIGGVGFLTRLLLPEKLSRVLFCLLVSLICAGCFLIVNTLASFWITASTKGQDVLSAIHTRFPDLPRGSTIIVDGVCPYVGPASVFESQWDLRGALETMYHDPTVHADIVTPRLYVTDKAIMTKIYTFPAPYPYKNLFIYNYKNNQTYPIPNAETAREYFQEYNPDLTSGCPTGRAGNGVDVF